MTLLGKIKAGALSLVLAANAFIVSPAMAQTAGGAGDNETTTCTQWQIDNGFCQGSARETIQDVLNFALVFLGLIAMAFLVFGGFLYVTAGASDDNVEKAKKIITYAVIGIVLIFLAWALVNTLIGGLSSGSDI